MLVSFRKTFAPTEGEMAAQRAMNEDLHRAAVGRRECYTCVYSTAHDNGKCQWLDCDVTGEEVSGKHGMDCWTEDGVPAGTGA